MGFLERAAQRRISKRLAGLLSDDEQILVFDLGRASDGVRVDCAATARALYLMPPHGETTRVPYTDILETGGGPSWITFTTISGYQYVLDFGSTPRGVSDVVVDHYRAVASDRRRVHVSWGNGGATFLVVPDPAGGEKIAMWTHDDGVEDDMQTGMLIEQAVSELEVSLGRRPSFPYESPTPAWMDLRWDPPLP